jgi:hypothetical protein
MSSSSAAVIATAGLALLAAGCGGSPGSSNLSAQSEQNGAVAFSRCMRSHGVPDYPDPTSNGLPPKKTPQQLGVSSSEFQSGQTACQSLLTNGGQPSQEQVAQYRSAMLVYARCIRSHGVSNMPDPDSRGRLDIGPGTDVDVNSPRFQTAFQACKSDLSP